MRIFSYARNRIAGTVSRAFLEALIKKENENLDVQERSAFYLRNANISHIVESDIYGTSATEGVIAL